MTERKTSKRRKTRALQLRPPIEVYRHLDSREGTTGWNKQQQAMAGLVAMEILGAAGRSVMIQYAKQVERDEDAWAKIVALSGEAEAEPLELEDLVAALASLGRLAGSKSTGRRRA